MLSFKIFTILLLLKNQFFCRLLSNVLKHGTKFPFASNCFNLHLTSNPRVFRKFHILSLCSSPRLNNFPCTLLGDVLSLYILFWFQYLIYSLFCITFYVILDRALLVVDFPCFLCNLRFLNLHYIGLESRGSSNPPNLFFFLILLFDIQNLHFIF